MNVTIANFSRAAIIPEVRTNISTRTSCDVHLMLICVATVWTLPNQLMIFIFNNLNLTTVTTHLAIIALRVQFSVHDIVVDVLDYFEYCINIILKICSLNITDASTLTESLIFTFKPQFGEWINMFTNIDVIFNVPLLSKYL